ncbi:MAG: glycosyltransferase family 4 protein [Kiritimatiellae bacterium]|nr:glycosyltransferase family 4 protein [Kiritimatiellia bacterium]
MRIAHVIRRLSFDDWGGTEQVVWNLAKAQRAAGHDVRLFATTALCATPHETVDGLEIVRFRPVYPWWPMPKALVAELDRKGGNPFVPGLGKALREWRPDVIHCHAMARIAELCLRVGARRRCVVSLHGGGANVPTEEAKSLKAPTRGRLPWGKAIDILMGWTRRVPEDFGGIVCVGEDEYEKYRARHPHVMYLPNGVDTSLFASCRSRTSGSGSPFRVLCVARIDRQKNQMLLVEWLARHPEATVRFVGPVTQPDYRAELEARAASLGVAGRLSFAGALKPASPELLAEYTAADAFVLPSRHEPFGIVVLEAWAAGLPVVASDVGGLGRLCAAHPDAALVFKPGDLDALDAALGRLAGEEGLAERLSAAGSTAASAYDWSVLAARLVDFYGEI